VDVGERLRILGETRNLKMLAEFFLHPEKPVRVDPTLRSRCYFDRTNAPQQLALKESEEAAKILSEMRSLKKLALDYMHPELPVETTDPTACARCFFDRASATPQDSVEEVTERDRILEDLKKLKAAAADYLHPEAPVKTEAALFGRNYFMRPSAPVQLTADEEKERQLILQDAKELAKLAHGHFARLALQFDPTECGRNYFTRPSAPDQLSVEEEEGRGRILQDAKALQQFAVHYHHPELPVVTTDPTVFGRNYFSRPSAPEQESEEDAERLLVLKDAHALQKLAIAYHHPDIPTVASDPTVFGRNYFERASAAPQTMMEDDEEEELVMIEAGRLEQLAMDYHHPEMPVRPRDPMASGRDLLAPPSIQDTGKVFAIAGDEIDDIYLHHTHFDLEDHIHRHHVDFDRNKAHHDEISCVTFASSPTSTRKVIRDLDQPIPSSPGCVMAFAQPKDISFLPTLQ
jgi:hypothetical protein